jgi:hypothetical protein
MASINDAQKADQVTSYMCYSILVQYASLTVLAGPPKAVKNEENIIASV